MGLCTIHVEVYASPEGLAEPTHRLLKALEERGTRAHVATVRHMDFHQDLLADNSRGTEREGAG